MGLRYDKGAMPNVYDLLRVVSSAGVLGKGNFVSEQREGGVLGSWKGQVVD